MSVRPSEILKVLADLCRQLDVIHASQDYKDVWFFLDNHGVTYQGPQYNKELEAAKRVLAKAAKR
jgi:hypothetical protein